MAFTEESMLFLLENHRQNSRDWFAEHKSAYKNHVETPMLELAQALTPVMLRIDPLLIVEPKRLVSRIWRDARFSKDKSVFKRASWFVFQRSKGLVHPCWFFEFTPDFHRYGCGYYSTPPKIMARIRELVLSKDPLYDAAQEALDGLAGFSLDGELYKRSHYPQASKKQRDWLDRKSITAMHTSRDPRQLFSDDLAGRLADLFSRLAPVYHFLLHAHESSQARDQIGQFYAKDAQTF